MTHLWTILYDLRNGHKFVTISTVIFTPQNYRRESFDSLDRCSVDVRFYPRRPVLTVRQRLKTNQYMTESQTTTGVVRDNTIDRETVSKCRKDQGRNIKDWGHNVCGKMLLNPKTPRHIRP